MVYAIIHLHSNPLIKNTVGEHGAAGFAQLALSLHPLRSLRELRYVINLYALRGWLHSLLQLVWNAGNMRSYPNQDCC
jgi:hypothetical protein